MTYRDNPVRQHVLLSVTSGVWTNRQSFHSYTVLFVWEIAIRPEHDQRHLILLALVV